MKCLLIQPQSGASQTLRRARQAALIKKFDKARVRRAETLKIQSARFSFGGYLQWRGCRSKSEKSRGRKSSKLFCPYPRDFSLNIKRSKTAFLRALPLKCGVRIFRKCEATRAIEGRKCEFLRVRRVRDLDTLPQKERKPRLKKTILRRNRVPPQRAMVRYIRGVVFEWRGCRSKSEKSRGRKSLQLFRLYPRDFSLKGEL